MPTLKDNSLHLSQHIHLDRTETEEQEDLEVPAQINHKHQIKLSTKSKRYPEKIVSRLGKKDQHVSSQFIQNQALASLSKANPLFISSLPIS